MKISVLIKRILAYLIDLIITLAIAACFFITPDLEANLIGSIAGAAWWTVAYMLFKDCLCARRSPGKFVLGLKIIDFETGKKPSFIALMLRNITFPLGFVEGIVALCNKGRCIGDIFAETKVVSRKD